MRRNNLVRTVIILIIIGWSLYQLFPTWDLLQNRKEIAAHLQKLEQVTGFSADAIRNDANLGLLESHIRERITNEDSLNSALAEARKYAALLEKSNKNETRAIKQGLDLQGGTYLVYEVDLPQLMHDIAKNSDDEFNELIKEVETKSSTNQDDFFDVLQNTFAAKGIRLSRYFGSRTQSDGQIVADLKKQAEDAIDRTLEVLRNRVDQFGVSEPSLTKQGNRRIVIELAGIQDVGRAKELIGKTALLEFKLLKDNAVTTAVMRDINNVMREKLKKTGAANGDTTLTGSTKPRAETEVGMKTLFGNTAIVGEDTTADADSTVLVDKDVFEENPFFSLLAGFRNDVAIPAKNLRAVQRILNSPEAAAKIPSDAEFLFSGKPEIVKDQQYYFMYLVKKEPELTGKYISDAGVTISSGQQSLSQGQPVVSLKLDREGGRIFARVTGANVGKRLAIVLDGKVASAPNIDEKIPTGDAIIRGSFSMPEAQELAIVLRAGALPAPVEVIEERTVGPSLGQDSVRRGQLSLGIGIALVVLFMIVYYRLSGIVADFALILNLFILLAMLAFFHATLTLPGVAGIILTMGMAVDANVLIFERIREELRSGKTVRASIDAGYDRAFWTIFDANLTTFLTALVLYQFGTGPIRGFAVTLSIGILASMFTAIVVTRLIFDFFTRRKTLSRLSI